MELTLEVLIWDGISTSWRHCDGRPFLWVWFDLNRTAHTPRAGKRGAPKSPAPSQDGADIDWILRGTGSLSRGSAGSVSLGVGGFGASGGTFGSSVSLRSAKSDEESGKRSSSLSSRQDTWNKHSVVPEIRKERPASEVCHSLPPSLVAAINYLKNHSTIWVIPASSLSFSQAIWEPISSHHIGQ